MPFLAPLAGPLIGLGSSLIGGLLGKKKSSGISNPTQSSGGQLPLLPPGLDQSGILAGVNKQNAVGDWLSTTGQGTFGQGNTMLQDPVKFYQSLLGGDRTAIMQSLAPEIATINQQFQAPLAQAGLTGRGTSLQPDIEASKQSAISNLIFSERPQAADKLSGIAQNLMQMGTQQNEFAGNLFGQSTQNIVDYNRAIRGLQYDASKDTAAQWGNLGAQLGPLLTKVLQGSGGGGTGGGDLGPFFGGGLPTVPFDLPTPSFPGIDVSGLGEAP